MDSTDIYLKKRLKNWAAKYPPPANGRARLLGKAAFSKSSHSEKKNLAFDHQPYDLFSWAMVYSLDRRGSALRLVS